MDALNFLMKKKQRISNGLQTLILNENEFHALCDKSNGILFRENDDEFFEYSTKSDLTVNLEKYCSKWMFNYADLSFKIENFSREELICLIALINLYWSNVYEM